MYVYTHVCVCIYIYIYVVFYLCMYMYVCVYTHVCVCRYIYVCSSTYICICMCVCILHTHAYTHVCVCVYIYTHSAAVYTQIQLENLDTESQGLQPHVTGWRRLTESPKLQIIFHNRATKYRSLLQKMTCKDKGSYESHRRL